MLGLSLGLLDVTVGLLVMGVLTLVLDITLVTAPTPLAVALGVLLLVAETVLELLA